jgi:hypothetical protein
MLVLALALATFEPRFSILDLRSSIFYPRSREFIVHRDGTANKVI